MALSAAMMAFFEESEGHLETIETSLLDLEKDSSDLDVVDGLFRAVHSLKGNSGLVGLTEIHAIATDMETTLGIIRERKQAVTHDEHDNLFGFLDKIKALVDDARGIENSSLSAVEESAPSVGQKTVEPKPVVETVKEPEQAPADDTEEIPSGKPEIEKTSKATTADVEETEEQFVDSTSIFLTFFLGKEHYGFEINSVKEILLKRSITHVPNVKPFVAGIMNLRGLVIPVIDAKIRLNFKSVDEDVSAGETIIIVEEGGLPTGVLVDRVEDIVKLEKDQIVGADRAMGMMRSQFIAGVGKAEQANILIIDNKTFCNSEEHFF